MNYWELLENQKCDNCGNAIIQLNEESFYCPVCRDELTLCGMYGICEGIAHNGPYTLDNGVLTEEANLVYGHCDTCGEGWEAS